MLLVVSMLTAVIFHVMCSSLSLLETDTDPHPEHSKSEGKNVSSDRSLEEISSASKSSDQLETASPFSLPPDPPPILTAAV